MSTVLSPDLAARMRQLSDETLVLALEAYRQGRYQGAAHICAELEEFARAQLDDVAMDGVLTPDARLACAEVLERLRHQLKRLARRSEHRRHPQR